MSELLIAMLRWLESHAARNGWTWDGTAYRDQAGSVVFPAKKQERGK